MYQPGTSEPIPVTVIDKRQRRPAPVSEVEQRPYSPGSADEPDQWLWSLRSKLRWTRRDLARRIGVNQRVIERWELGLKPLRRASAIAQLNDLAVEVGMPCLPGSPCPERKGHKRDG